MEECGYVIKKDGEFLRDKNKKIVVFKTDEALDSWIYENRDALLADIDSLDIIPEIPVHQQIIDTIKRLDTNFRAGNISESERIGVTDLWGSVDAGNWVYKKKYEEIAVSQMMKELGITKEEATKIYKEETSGTTRGTDFHKILERKWNEPDKPIGKNEDGKSLDSEEYKNDRATADSFIRTITAEFENKFGKRDEGWFVLTEQAIFSSALNKEKKEQLWGMLGQTRQFNYIAGIVDLIIVTKTGEIHIYDYKTSSRTKPSNWYETDRNIIKREGSYSPFTKREYEAQVLSYDCILEKAGLNNVHVHLAKFLRDERPESKTKGTISKYEGIVDFLNVSPVRGNVLGLFDIPVETKIENLKNVHNQMSSCFGNNSSVSKQSEGFKRNVDWFMSAEHFLKPVEPDSPEGKNGKTWFFMDNLTGKPIYTTGTREDARKQVEEYVNRLNNAASEENYKLGKDLVNIKTREQLSRLAKTFSKKFSEEMIRVFEKFIVNGWTLCNNDLLCGNGIFLFQKGNRSEIVMVESADPLNKKVKLDRGTSILGNFLYDDEFGSDNINYLEATIGNMLLMKAVSYVSNEWELFRTKKLNRITVFNPVTGETINNTSLSVLANNWKTLSFFRRSLKLRDIKDLINSDADAAIELARDYISTISGHTTNLELFQLQKSEVDYTEEELLKILKNLDWVYKNGENADWRVKLAHGEVYKALLYIHGKYHVTREGNVGKYLTGGLSFNGGYVSPMALSPSANLRTINKISITFHNKLAQEAEKIIAVFQKKLKDTFGKEFSSLEGGQWDLFLPWFKTDENGQIDQSFSLKDPETDPYFKDKPKEADLCKYILDTFAQFKWEKNWESRVGTQEYYEIPLVEPISNWEIMETNKFSPAIKKVIHRSFRNVANVMSETVSGNWQKSGYVRDSKEELNVDKIANYFFDGSRQERFERLADKHYGPGYFEKNLDVVFLSAVVAGTKSRLSTSFMPLFTGMRALLAIENQFNKAQMTSILQAVDDYVGSVVLNKSMIPDELRRLNSIINTLKGLVSKLTLGLSSKNYVRELSGSAIRTAFQAAIKDPRFKYSFTEEEYMKALKEMMVNFHEAFISNSKDTQLNTKFRAANMSYYEMAKNLRSGKYGIKNIDDDFWFQTSTLPDFIHRLAVLKATLMHEGAYDAYVMKDNILEYDWTKDKRFEILFKYATNGKLSESDSQKITDKKDLDLWIEQSNNYKKYLAAWAQAGEYLSYGDPLPEALDPDQQITFKTQTDILYGNYDNESKSLIQRTLLGSMFFQFKTFGISRMIEWWKAGGAVNIILPQQMIDPETRQLVWERKSTLEEIAAGKGEFQLVLDSEVTEEDKRNNRVWPWKQYLGAYQEGRMQTIFSYLIAANKPEELERLWKNEAKKANLYSALHDLWLWVVLAGLIRLLYGDEIIDTMSEQDWWTRWTYAVVMGIAQDGPIWEIAKSLWSNGEIPMFSALSKYISTGMSVINGNTYVWNGVLNTFGATREFSNLISD